MNSRKPGARFAYEHAREIDLLANVLHEIGGEFCSPFTEYHPIQMHRSQGSAILTGWLAADQAQPVGEGPEPNGGLFAAHESGAGPCPCGRVHTRTERQIIEWAHRTPALPPVEVDAGLREALEWAMAPNPRYQGRHRTEPRCSTFMPTDGSCDCGYEQARAALAHPVVPEQGLDVERLARAFIDLCNRAGWSVYRTGDGGASWVDRNEVARLLATEYAALRVEEGRET